MSAEDRAARTAAADTLCREAYVASLAGVPETGLALVAVGGYGRGELAPFSDLDVVLVHDVSVDVGPVAQRIWYPLWDAGVDLDHSVRALPEVTRAADGDVRVALGLLDARHVAGDSAVTLRLRADVLAGWRRNARANLPRVRDLVRERSARVGELAHASVPDLKESSGGLRDATVLKALAATWLVDVPHVDLERCRLQLLDVRDVLQAAAGRASDRVAPELWAPLADGLRLGDEADAQRRLREIGRRTAHLSRLTWNRVDRILAPSPAAGGRAPELVPLAAGVAMSAGEVVLARGADPANDPLLLLRAAEAAARNGAGLAPSTAARLAARSVRLPEPWPAEARDLFVRLLAAGPGLLAVWETLDETGALDLLLPEWRRIWLLPHASPVHRFTVDRHVVETCIEAARLIRRVGRPDLLLMAALLHDIGKGGRTDHSVRGEPVAAAVAARLGFDDADVRTIACLVRWHLLLVETATTRDLDDPATATAVASAIDTQAALDLLEQLTEADARATATQAWTPWRAGLVHDLASRVRSLLAPGGRLKQVDDRGPDVDGATAEAVHADPAYRSVRVVLGDAGVRVEVTAADRIGLMADVAGALALLRVSVRAAHAWTRAGIATSWWEVDDVGLEAVLVAQRLDAVVSGAVDVAARVGARPSGLPPMVLVRHDASAEATLLEVRTDDRLGVVFLVTRALAALHLTVRSAHLSTFGPQALDVFYVQEPGAGALTDDRAADAAHAVRSALEGELPVPAER